MSDTFATQRRRPLVWIVDDSPLERAHTERSLGESYAYEHFSDGAEVVERLLGGNEQPDVMLLDWVMPGMSGDAVCRFLRSDERTRELPIIMVTGNRLETSDVVEGLDLGASDYVARPFVPSELHARVNSVLRNKDLRDTASRERSRLAAINQLARRLFEVGGNVERIVEELAETLTRTVCDGCSVLLLPGELTPTFVTRHHGQASGAELALISTVADPGVQNFASSAEAARVLPPAYHAYIARFGLRGLAILPFPSRAEVQGVVTITRDGGSSPLAHDDIVTIETCIEYTSLAVQNAMRLTNERAARGLLDAVLDHAPIGIVVNDRAGAVTLANPSAAVLVPGIEQATTPAEVFRLCRWTSPDGVLVDEVGWLAARASEPRERTSTELLVSHFDGSGARRLSMSTVPLIMAGEHVGDVTTIEDVSAAREIAAERDRVAKFQEQMLGIVGHDLRNPLSAVLMGADAIDQYASESPDVLKVTARVRRAGERMLGIIEQLLDVTRARLGAGIPVEPRDVSLTPVVRGVLDELAAAHPATSFQLIGDEEVRGLWDPDRLSQVVSNLASNAVLYGRPTAPIVVEISHSDRTATVTVTNAVRDQPIDPARLRELFDPYQRGRDGKRHAHGLGLGLYIVSEIVRAHHGTIAAESTRAGTVFRVELPRHAVR